MVCTQWARVDGVARRIPVGALGARLERSALRIRDHHPLTQAWRFCAGTRHAGDDLGGSMTETPTAIAHGDWNQVGAAITALGNGSKRTSPVLPVRPPESGSAAFETIGQVLRRRTDDSGRPSTTRGSPTPRVPPTSSWQRWNIEVNSAGTTVSETMGQVTDTVSQASPPNRPSRMLRTRSPVAPTVRDRQAVTGRLFVFHLPRRFAEDRGTAVIPAKTRVPSRTTAM